MVSFDQLKGAVAAPVVDEQDLIRTTEAFERLGQLAVEDAQAFHLVEDRQDHRDLDLLHPGVLPRSRSVNAYGQSVTLTVKSILPLAVVYPGVVPHCHCGSGVTRLSTAPSVPGKMPLFLP